MAPSSTVLPTIVPSQAFLTPPPLLRSAARPLPHPVRRRPRPPRPYACAAVPPASSPSNPSPPEPLLPRGLRFNDEVRKLIAVRAPTRRGLNPAPQPDQARAQSDANPATKLTPRRAESTLTRVARFFLRAAKEDGSLWWRVSLAITVMVASKCLNVVTPWLFKQTLDVLGSAGSGSVQQSVVRQTAAKLLLGFGVLRVVASCLHEARNAAFAEAGQTLGRLVTRSSFAHLQSLETAFHAKKRTGILVGVVDRGTKSVLAIFRSLLFSFAPSVLELVLVCAVLLRNFSPTFLLATLVTFAIFVLFTVKLNEEMATTRRFMNAIDKEGSAKLTDSFFNIDSVKYFGNERFELLRYDACLQEYKTEAVRAELEYAGLNLGQGAIFNTGICSVMLLAVNRIVAGSMTVGDLIMASTLLQQLWVPLSFLGWQYRDLKQSLIHMDDLFDLLDTVPSINDASGATDLQVNGGEIEFRNVAFSYSGDVRPVIRELSFKVPAGKTLAIVGESGSGKSTALKLLYRLYEPQRGSILIDGQDISTVTQESLRRAIGMVPQDTALFNDTIHYNIAYGKPDATREEVETASRASSIHDTIVRMPEGYETVVGDKGVRLSGGERQRVAIARCILKAPRILVCDEATSALDSKTEEEITRSLRTVQEQRTSIVIAHRLSTVVDSDEILVMKGGVVVERGSHAALVGDPKSEYSQMWARQLKDRDQSSGRRSGDGLPDDEGVALSEPDSGEVIDMVRRNRAVTTGVTRGNFVKDEEESMSSLSPFEMGSVDDMEEQMLYPEVPSGQEPRESATA